MTQYDNEKKFALFKNDKGDNPKRPDYRGTLTLNGVAYKLSAWIATDKKGAKYMRGSLEVDQKAAPPTPAASYGTYEPAGKVATVTGPAATPAPVRRDLTGAPINDDENVPF